MEAWIIVVLMDTFADPTPSVLPPLEVCRRARKSRDPRFDGHFFVAVLTTGIYCRTTCPVRMPREENVRYFASAAGAQDSGFRPCRRCRPECAQRLPEWTLKSDTVRRALRLIEDGYLNEHKVADLALRMGVSERQLCRLFTQELGASPKTIAQVLRARLAKNLLLGSGLKHAEIAFHAGYGSVSRFNAEVRRIFDASPREIRQKKRAADDRVVLKLPIRGLYDFDWMFEYLKRRALGGLEEVTGRSGNWRYSRRVPLGCEEGCLHVFQDEESLGVELPLGGEPLHGMLTRIRRMFDLDADGHTIHESLFEDPLLGEWVRARPGLRVPGAWDGFETAVRAILGQQVSVERGTELATRMIAGYGQGWFPHAEQLVQRDIAELGMPGNRGRAISSLARQVLDGSIVLDDAQDFAAAAAQIQSVRGIGPWTANYVRMRVSKDPDAFPDNDWVVMKALHTDARGARHRAEAWRPWRAYALMYVWQASAVLRQRQ